MQKNLENVRKIYLLKYPAGLRRYNSIPHPSSLPPALWMSWEANEGGGGERSLYTVVGSLPSPCRAAGPLLPSGVAAGGLPSDRGAAGSRQGRPRK